MKGYFTCNPYKTTTGVHSVYDIWLQSMCAKSIGNECEIDFANNAQT